MAEFSSVSTANDLTVLVAVSGESHLGYREPQRTLNGNTARKPKTYAGGFAEGLAIAVKQWKRPSQD